MKKIIIILAGLMAAMTLITGCGNEEKETTQNNGFVDVEVVYTEAVITEQILTESTITERVFIDNEYQNEVDFNSKTNSWDNNPNITYWD